MKSRIAFFSLVLLLALGGGTAAWGISQVFHDRGYTFPALHRVTNHPKLRVGQEAPDFRLPTLEGTNLSLSQFRGKKNVVISFIPAAWEVVSSAQWAEYQALPELFNRYDAMLIGISVDNIPTLHVWRKELGSLWFPVLSDFYPHGHVTRHYGLLRPDGMAERAIVVIDKKGRIRSIQVYNPDTRPKLEILVRELEKLSTS